jgi:hypothetical protein
MGFVKGHGSSSGSIGKVCGLGMATGYEVRQGGVGYVRIPFRLGMKGVPLCSLQHEKEALF